MNARTLLNFWSPGDAFSLQRQIDFPPACKYRLMLWANGTIPFLRFWYSVCAHAVHVHCCLNKHTQCAAVSCPPCGPVFQTVDPTGAVMSGEIRLFRSHSIKSFRQCYSSVCVEWGEMCSGGSKPNFKEITTNPSAVQIAGLGPGEQAPPPGRARQSSDSHGCWGLCWVSCVWEGGEGGSTGLLFPKPRTMALHHAIGPCIPRHLVWWRTPGIFPKP